MLIYGIEDREGIARDSIHSHFHAADIGFRQIMIALAMEKSKWYNLNLANVFFKSGQIFDEKHFKNAYPQKIVSIKNSL